MTDIEKLAAIGAQAAWRTRNMEFKPRPSSDGERSWQAAAVAIADLVRKDARDRTDISRMLIEEANRHSGLTVELLEGVASELDLLADLKRELAALTAERLVMVGRIAELEGERDKLESERDLAQESYETADDERYQIFKDEEAANSRVERLQEALERIASGYTGTEPFPYRNLSRDSMKKIAQKALADDAKEVKGV